MFQTEPTLPRRRGHNGLLNRIDDQLPHRATPALGFCAQSAMQIAREIDTGPDVLRFHGLIPA
jgi:hypothetical protein